MSTTLTRGAVANLTSGKQIQHPRLCVIAMKGISTGEGKSMKVNLTDGVQTIVGTLTSQLFNRVKETVKEGSIITLDKYMIHNISGRVAVTVTEIVESETITNSDFPLNKAKQEQTSPQQPQQPQKQTSQIKPQQQQSKQQQSFQQMLSSPKQNSNRLVDLSTMPIKSISSINPYSGKWVIKAKVFRKSDIKEWANAKGTGKLFNVDLVDANGGELHATAFNKDVDLFEPLMHVGKVYYITNGKLKPASKFNTTNNAHELNLNEHTIVQEAFDDATDIQLSYHFIPISEIKTLNVNDNCDIIGIILNLGDVMSFTSKTGKDLTKRTMTIGDNTLTSIDYSIWGKEAEEFAGNQGDVIALKGARISEYNDRSMTGGMITLNPDINESNILLGWYANNDDQNAFSSISVSSFTSSGTENTKTVSTIKEAKEAFLSLAQNTIKMTHVGVFSNIPVESRPLVYASCPNCKKKVIETNDMYSCSQCGDVSECVYRFIFSGVLMDSTGNMWVSVFGDQGDEILGTGANRIASLKSEGLEDEIMQVVNNTVLRERFTVVTKTKMEEFGGELRPKTSVLSVRKVNVVDECDRVTKLIQSFGY